MSRFNLSEWAIKHQALTRYFLMLLLLGGIFSYAHLGQNEDPDFTFRVMVVSVNWPGATAQEMSDQVVDKIERKLQETPYLDKLRSYSKPGQALIFVNLKGATPPKEVAGIWYQVRKKVSDIRHTLPEGIQGPNFNDEFGDTYGTIYAFSADGFSYAELKDYVDQARQALLHVPNVAKVELLGVQEEKLYIEFSTQKFAQMGLSVNQIANTLAAQNGVTGSGLLVTPIDNYQIRLTGALLDVQQIENLTLRLNGTSFRLGDFATVKRTYQDPPSSKMRFNGKEVIGVGISMAKNGDVIELGRNLNEAFDRIKQQMPIGIELEKVADQPAVVKKSVREFVQTLIEAVVIVLLVSFVSLGLHFKPFRIDVRPGLVVALTIPLVLAVTFFFMWLGNIDLQKISLGALIIALGLLVDDAIIAVEMMVLKLEEGYDKLSAASFAYTSTAKPMLTGTLITIAGFLPVGLAKSVAGEYTFSIFAVTGISLLVSWFVAVYFTPYLGYLILKEHKQPDLQHHAVFQTPFYSGFRRLVDWCVRFRKTVIVITLLAFIVGIMGFGFIQQQFFPNSSRPELNVELWLPEGASYEVVERETLRFEALLKDDPAVLNYVSYIADGSPRFYLPFDQQIKQSNLGQIIVLAKDSQSRDALRTRLLHQLETGFPMLRGRINLLPNGPPVPYPVAFRLNGDDPVVLKKLAEEVKAVMRQNPYTLGVNDNWNENVKVIRFQLDQEKARALGITTEMLAQAAQTILSGTTIGQLRDGNKTVDIVIRQPVDERMALSRLASASIPTLGGKTVPLSQVAKAYFDWEDGVIWRFNRKLSITVQSDVLEGMQGPYVTGLVDRALSSIREKLPFGYSLEVGGSVEESKEGSDSINANMPLMIVVIITLLMVQLQSFARTVLVFLTAPLGLIGAAMALLVFQAPFGFVATLGVIALSGMIMRNSVILVDQIERDIQAGHSPWTAIVESAVRRFRPIILTAAAAVLAMIPLTRSIFWGPMAIAIMGGLIIATVLTLLFLPALYAFWFKVERNKRAP